MRPRTTWLPGLLAAALLLSAGWTALCAPASPTAGRGFVARITLDGPIGPAAAEYFDDASQRARKDGARAIVLRMDTPGGLSASMHNIVASILASPIPVLGYVAPAGARAASAGTYILYACHVAAMAPATHLGAATPVALGGHTPMPSPAGSAPSATSSSPAKAPEGDAESHKVLNDAIAYIHSLAQLRGRNAAWAEQAVRGAATLTANEAVARHVVDFTAGDVQVLLRKASGLQVKLGRQTRTLALAGLPVRDYAPDWRTRFLGIITNPTVAYILIMAGLYGLILEAFHPGVFFPGVVGAICLLIGLYALQLLPVSYAGLALIALGVGLMLAEVFTPSFGVLGLGGAAAFLVGSIMLFHHNVPGYGISLGVITGLAFSALAVLALIVALVARARRAQLVSGDPVMVNAFGEVLQAVPAGGKGWARVHGERWRIRSDSALAIGARVRVTRRDGLTLWVEPA